MKKWKLKCKVNFKQKILRKRKISAYFVFSLQQGKDVLWIILADCKKGLVAGQREESLPNTHQTWALDAQYYHQNQKHGRCHHHSDNNHPHLNRPQFLSDSYPKKRWISQPRWIGHPHHQISSHGEVSTVHYTVWVGKNIGLSDWPYPLSWGSITETLHHLHFQIVKTLPCQSYIGPRALST